MILIWKRSADRAERLSSLTASSTVSSVPGSLVWTKAIAMLLGRRKTKRWQITRSKLENKGVLWASNRSYEKANNSNILYVLPGPAGSRKHLWPGGKGRRRMGWVA